MTELEVADDRQAAVERYRKILSRDPGSLRFAEFADELRRHGSLSEAAAVCARGLLRHPHYATGHVVMGEIFRDRKLPEKAEQEWREALRLDPGHPRAHLRVGELCLERGDTEQAASESEAALLLNPESPEAYALMAGARGESGGKTTGGKTEEVSIGSWRPSRRPSWLTADRLEEVVAAVCDCPSVEGAILANADGLALAGGLASSGDPQAGTAMAVELVRRAREWMVRLGAGKLRAALVQGRKGGVRCLSLGDLTLVASLKPEARAGTLDAEIEDALASLSNPARGGEQPDG